VNPEVKEQAVRGLSWVEADAEVVNALESGMFGL
jgi:hypothetical protein